MSINQNTVVLDIPVNINIIKKLSHYTYDLQNFIPNQSVDYKIICFSDTNECINVLIGKIDGDEYILWGNDDLYIQNLINQKVLDLAK